MSYSPEYDVQARGVDVNLLNDMAAITAGRDMSEDAALPFVHNLVARNAFTPLWPLLLLLALLLLPLDIAIRRLIITQSDLRRMRAALFSIGRREVVEGPSERLTSLMGAKARGRQRTEEAAGTVAALRANRARTRPEREAAAVIPDREKPRYVPPAAQPQAGRESTNVNVAGELLKTRRKRDQDRP
jgi:hypothetical protein